MEKDVALGEVGQLKLSFAGGKAKIEVMAAVDGGAVSAQVAIVADASMLIDQLQAIVEKAIPASAPIDPIIFGAIKQAVLAIA